jgi:hypothetical protein
MAASAEVRPNDIFKSSPINFSALHAPLHRTCAYDAQPSRWLERKTATRTARHDAARSGQLRRG